jgi:hypothetical protein
MKSLKRQGESITGPAAGFKSAAGEAFSEWTVRYQPAM